MNRPTRIRTLPISLLLLAAASLSACGDDEPDAAEAVETDLEVQVRFELRAGEQPAGCDDTLSLGVDADAVTLSDARLYVHAVTLTGPDGDAELTLQQDEVWQLDGLALIDFENGEGACANGNAATNTVVVGTVPAGDYDGLRFDIGVPFDRNHDDAATAPAPLSYSAMFWNWQGGYKFIRLEGLSDGDPMRLHLGSTGCEGTVGDISSCARPNRPRVTLADFDVTTDTVVLDLVALFAGAPAAFNTAETSPGCMSAPDDPDCVALFGNLGLDPATGQASPGTQSVFVAR